MTTISVFVKKFLLASLVLAVSFTTLPVLSASAAAEESTAAAKPQVVDRPIRLERAWGRAQNLFHRQGRRLEMADESIARLQERLEQAAGKGWDTTAVQAALDAFAGVIPAAQAVHDSGTVLITTHPGFDSDGLLIDKTQAVATLKELVKVIKDTRTALEGTGQALRQAVKAMRDANLPKP